MPRGWYEIVALQLTGPAAASRQADAVVMTIGNGSSDLAGRVAPPPSRLNTSLGATGGCLENEGTDRKSTAVPQLQLPVLRAVLNATAAGRKPVVAGWAAGSAVRERR